MEKSFGPRHHKTLFGFITDCPRKFVGLFKPIGDEAKLTVLTLICQIVRAHRGRGETDCLRKYVELFESIEGSPLHRFYGLDQPKIFPLTISKKSEN